MNNTTFSFGPCLSGYKPKTLGIPTPMALCVIFPINAIGSVLNIFALAVLASQKQYANQELYIGTLSLFGFIMAGPCLIIFAYGNARKCYDWPQIVSDIRIFLVQLSAGVSIWLVVFISFDRLLMVHYKEKYRKRVTKSKTAFAIAALILWYLVICTCIDFSPYFTSNNHVPALAVHPAHIMLATFLHSPTETSHILNMLRMVTDRILPWILCTVTYARIFYLRRKHKKLLIQPVMMNETNGRQARSNTITSNLRKRSRLSSLFWRSFESISVADERSRRNRILIIGITASLFFCLTPETIFDMAMYVFGVSLRNGAWQMFGLVWYMLTIANPIIYIMSIPHLRLGAGKLIRKAYNRLYQKRQNKIRSASQGTICQIRQIELIEVQ